MEPKKILVVEDEKFLAHLLKSRLEKEGFKPVVARDGEEALNLLREPGASFDLILLDIILPKMSGFEFMEEASKDPQIKFPPVIIVSNLGQTEDISRGKQLGAADYFVKAQVSIDDLVQRVKNFLK